MLLWITSGKWSRTFASGATATCACTCSGTKADATAPTADIADRAGESIFLLFIAAVLGRGADCGIGKPAGRLVAIGMRTGDGGGNGVQTARNVRSIVP